MSPLPPPAESADAPRSVDLHTHSLASDGALAHADLVRAAARAGIGLLALTDHDTTAGVAEAAEAAVVAGVELVPGVEISAGWRSQSIHVLGLWIDVGSRALTGLLERQHARRQDRLERMCERLSRLGLPGDACLRAVRGATRLPTRTHLAQALTDLGCVGDLEAAFRRYLKAGRPACIACDWPSIEEAVMTITAAGGRAVLAHPARYKLSAGGRRALLEAFRSAGGCGLEIVSGGQGASHTDALADLARRHGLQGSVGSDFHAPGRTWNPMGRLAKLPDSITPIWHGARPTREHGRSAASPVS